MDAVNIQTPQDRINAVMQSLLVNSEFAGGVNDRLKAGGTLETLATKVENIVYEGERLGEFSDLERHLLELELIDIREAQKSGPDAEQKAVEDIRTYGSVHYRPFVDIGFDLELNVA